MQVFLSLSMKRSTKVKQTVTIHELSMSKLGRNSAANESVGEKMLKPRHL